MVKIKLPYDGETLEEAQAWAEQAAAEAGDYGAVALSCTDESKSNNGLPQFFIEVGHPDYPQDTFGVTVIFYRRK